MCPHLHHERRQSIQSCLFDAFNYNNHFLFCNNTSKSPVLLMYGHYVPLIILFFSIDAENKAIKKHKLLSHSTNNLKPKKKGKLNMIRGDSKFKMGDGKRPLDVNL